MNEFARLHVKDGVAALLVDNPPVNALSPGVPEALMAAIDLAAADPNVQVLFIAGAGRTFIAGADVNELQEAARNPESGGPDLHPLLAKVEDCPKPVVMGLHGTALGGGLELAMAGHYRIATSDAQLGAPEANLGIIPGAEGTQRLPRLVGIPAAVDLCVTGRLIKAAEALQLGLIDRIVEGDLIAGAYVFAREVMGKPLRKTRERADKLGSPEENAAAFEAGRKQAAKIRPHQTAPLKAIEALEAATAMTFEEGCRRERELAKQCLASPQAQAMIHVFFAERAVAKVPGISEAKPLPVRKVAIIGAGTMGGGIAMACANAGIPVILRDVSQEAVDRGMETVRRNYERSVKRGRTPQAVMDQRMAMIRPQLTSEGFAEADLIIEAAFESMGLKKQLFAEIDQIAKPECVLATNTSTLDIDEIAAATSRPHMVIGLHFFSPANVMRLVEIVRGKATSHEVIATALAFAKTLKKVGVLVRNCRGFVGNRMMFPYMREAQFLVEEGATPEQVDAALTDFGMAMGIMAVDDLGGIDLLWRVRQEYKHLDKPGVRKPVVHDRLYEAGRWGQKRRAGWYRYDENLKPSPDPEVHALIEKTSRELGMERRPISNQEIVERCLFAMINEGVKILEEGYASKASDIDVIYTTGYGFPAWRGGPMWYGQTLGWNTVYRGVLELQRRFGSNLWAPSQLLRQLAEGSPLRQIRFGARDVTVENNGTGAIYVRPVHPLGAFPEKITDRLDHWAAKTPDRVFFGQRDAAGEWRTLSYAQFRSAARRIAQGLLDRPHVSLDRPVAILSGNDLEHALLGFAAYYAGVPYAPVSTAYSLVSTDFSKLRHIFSLLTPGLVFVSEGEPYKRALEAVLPKDAELVVSGDPGGLKATAFDALAHTAETPAVDRVHITADTVGKLLFTSGSTGTPKGVVQTQRMLTSNQQLVRNILAWVEDEPPVLCDWLPWNHTFGGNHDVGFVLYNGGSFYIDEGRPTPAGMAATVRNVFDVRPNVYLNVPKGFEALLPFLRERREFRERFFGSVKMLYYAGAGLSQPVWEELQKLAVETCGERILMFTGLGSTETGPAAMFPGKDLRRAGEIGLPAPGVELKLVPRGEKLEARLKGPGITPGYWRQPELTAAAFDEEGFYCIGDAFRFADPEDINRGFVFDGRLVEDFKLSTGTFVSTGPLRAKFLAYCSPYAQDIVIAGHDRDYVTALVFPAMDVCSQLSRDELRAAFQTRLNELAEQATGSSSRIARIILLDDPPSIDRHEITDKGSLNQSAVLRNRALLVEDLYSDHPSLHVISIQREIAK